eukprot:SAG11_NODE_1413_length_4981_cov_2.208726_2_plen_363_part_00
MPFHCSGASWNQSGCPSRCHDSNRVSWIGPNGPVTPPSFRDKPLVAGPPNQAFFARDKPGTLRAVGGDAICACAGKSCSSTSLLNKTVRPFGGCRPQTRPAPPWFTFSSARTLEYTANPTTGMVDTHIVRRQATFTGLPRGVWPNCSKVRHSEAFLPGEDNSHGTDHPDDSLTTSDNPLRLMDGSLLVQVAVCFGDRPLGWNPPGAGPGCGLVNNSGSPCMAPTQVLFRSTDEGRIWLYQGTLMNPADYPHSQNPTAMSESALTQLADGSLMAILRFDGDCGCAPPKTEQHARARGECGVYRYYHQVFSTDGRSWSHAKAVNGTGCVKPRMMMLGEPGVPGPLLLTGGRMCVENVTDVFSVA